MGDNLLPGPSQRYCAWATEQRYKKLYLLTCLHTLLNLLHHRTIPSFNRCTSNPVLVTVSKHWFEMRIILSLAALLATSMAVYVSFGPEG
jgi:hypothetical protein